LLGNVSVARNAFRDSAEYYTKYVRDIRNRRDELDPVKWEEEPGMLVRALHYGILGSDWDSVTDPAELALTLNDAYLDRFSPEYDNSPFRYYNAKVLAAIVADHTDQAELLTAFDDAIDGLGNPLATELSSVYGALIDRDAAAAKKALFDLLEIYRTERAADHDDPDAYMETGVTALVRLAQELSLDVTIESEYVPAALLDESDTASEATTDPQVDRVAYDATDDEYVLTVIIDHPGDREVTATDLPSDEGGRVFTEEWFQTHAATLAATADADRPLVETLDAGDVVRELVIIDRKQSTHLFDESVGELVDDVTIKNTR
jgi:hypothetical protein